MLEKQQVCAAMTTDRMILVVSSIAADAENLRGLIEFMDTPNVKTALPGDWRTILGDARLAALFVGQDLSTDEVDSLLGEVVRMDPNVPIVMLDSGVQA
jgi:hypothetical protein